MAKCCFQNVVSSWFYFLQAENLWTWLQRHQYGEIKSILSLTSTLWLSKLKNLMNQENNIFDCVIFNYFNLHYLLICVSFCACISHTSAVHHINSLRGHIRARISYFITILKDIFLENLSLQYLIWKLSLVVKNHKVGKGVAALLHSTTSSWKVSIYFMKRQTSGFEGA